MGITIDGCPPGIALTEQDFLSDLARRKSGAKGTTPRQEKDMPELISGIFNGHTTGAPITILFKNENTRSADYTNLLASPRPGHASNPFLLAVNTKTTPSKKFTNIRNCTIPLQII